MSNWDQYIYLDRPRKKDDTIVTLKNDVPFRFKLAGMPEKINRTYETKKDPIVVKRWIFPVKDLSDGKVKSMEVGYQAIDSLRRLYEIIEDKRKFKNGTTLEKFLHNLKLRFSNPYRKSVDKHPFENQAFVITRRKIVPETLTRYKYELSME